MGNQDKLFQGLPPFIADKLHETKHHDFQLMAEIDGVSYTYKARRKSPLAREIIENGRAKMSAESIKKLIEQYFVPLANKKSK